MISAEQIRQIAALPDSVDFRFEWRFDETIVVVTTPRGEVVQIHEDGSQFGVMPSGNTWSLRWETCWLGDNLRAI